MRGNIKLQALAVALALLLAAPAAAETAHHDDLVRLVKIMGGEQTSEFMMQAMQQQLAALMGMAAPEKQQAIITVIDEEITREQGPFLSEVVNEVAAVWGQFLTQAEVLELIEIYQQPVMSKAVRLLPAVMQESQLRGAKLGKAMMMRVMPRIERRLKKEHGIDLK